MTTYERRVSIQLPLSEDGFLQRQCPFCQTMFAINASEFTERGHLNLRCPVCRLVDKADSFTTAEQAAYAEAVGQNELRGVAENAVQDAISDMFTGLKSSKYMKIKGQKRRPDLGAQKIPSAFSDINLKEQECGDCRFPYATDPRAGNDACPVCRN